MLRLTDERFDERVAAHINLSNSQLAKDEPHKVAMSALYAAARFNIWLFARNNASGAEMFTRRQEAMDTFTAEFQQMLSEHFDDYAKNHRQYLG